MKQRPGFQQWGKGMSHSSKTLLDARTPSFKLGFEVLGGEEIIYQQEFTNTFLPSQLSA